MLELVSKMYLDRGQARSYGREHRQQLLELADLLCNRRERPGLFAQDVFQPVINGAWGHLLATLVDALGVGRPLKLARGCLDHLSRDSREVVGISAGQCRIAQGVDQARGTPGVLVDDWKGLRQEQHTVRRPGGAQPKEDVLAELLLAHGGDVVAQLHALNQLLHVRMVEDLVELRLPDKDHVQDLFLARFQPCEHAYFLEHFGAEIVRVIDDQHDLPALHELLQQEGIEHVEQFNFLRIERIESEIHEHRLQKLDFVKLRLEYLRNNHVFVEFRQDLLDKRGLAAADFSRDHHEAFAVPHGVIHVSLGAGVSLAHEKKPDVRRELERLRLQAEMLEIHVHLPSGYRAVLWPCTIAQKQHETVVHVTLRENIGNFAVALQALALGRDGQLGRKSVSHAQGGSAVGVSFFEIRPENR